MADRRPEKIYDVWSRAHDDLPGLVESMQPKIGELARKALSIVANIGVGLLQFLASFIVAGILMAYGEAGARGSRAIFERIVGSDRGETFAKLATATSVPSLRESSASPSSRRSSSALRFSSPTYRGQAFWRSSLSY